MEVFFMLVFISMVSPSNIVVNVAVSLLSRKKWIIPLSGLSAYLITEILLYSNNQHLYFGQYFPPLLLGSILQAYIIYQLRNGTNLSFFKKRQKD